MPIVLRPIPRSTLRRRAPYIAILLLAIATLVGPVRRGDAAESTARPPRPATVR